MSPLLQKKRHHEERCAEHIEADAFTAARYEAAQAADVAFQLAAQSTGAEADAYLEDGEGWLDIAESLPVTGAGPETSTPAVKGRAGAESPPASEFQFAGETGVTFEDIAGMETAKNTIREMVVYPLKEPEKARALGLNPGGGVLLYGPPGNGKTLLGKAIASEIDGAFFYASGAQIRSKWHGESEQRLQQLIADARAHPVSVLFLDEVDGLLPRRTDEGNQANSRLVAQFLAEIGGFSEPGNILLLVGATNKPWSIDEAAFRTGRFDEKIYIPEPDVASRRAILDLQLRNVTIDGAWDRDAFAASLDLFSGSDIAGLVLRAKRLALRRAVSEGSEARIRATDLDRARSGIFPSINHEMLARFKAFGSAVGVSATVDSPA